MLNLTQLPFVTDLAILDYLSKDGNSLAKAILNTDLLKSYREGLIQVQRTVNRNGKSFIQNYWVKPDQVRKTDVVMRGTSSKDTKQLSLGKEVANNHKLTAFCKDIGIAAQDIKTAKFLKKCSKTDGKRTRELSLGRFYGVTSDSSREYNCTLEDVDKSTFKRIYKLFMNNYSTPFATEGDKEKQFKKSYRINGIYKIKNLPIENQFNDIKSNNAKYKNETVLGKNCQSTILFHGTTHTSALNILGKTGQIGLGHGIAGLGVYLSDNPCKAIDYALMKYSDKDIKGAIFLCETSLGSHVSYSMDDSDEIRKTTREKGKNVDSVVIQDEHDNGNGVVKDNIFTIHNSAAIMPRYVIDIEYLD